MRNKENSKAGVREMCLSNRRGMMMCVCILSSFSHVQLCNPIDCSPPGSPVHGILQARILEWIAMLSSRGSSQPRDLTEVSYVSCFGRRVLYH